MLDPFYRLSREAAASQVMVHALRNLAAGFPLTVVSKTLRHSTLSATANLYSYLIQQAARAVADIIDHVLSGVEQPADHSGWPV
ncbi:hypothetical protein [Streptomyces sp. NPDC096068]|uniref:hypothetical protein n=1 Tax=Streptomyces sp. NPDC096068 TaxID=3155424 RepID=UPI0033178B7F